MSRFLLDENADARLRTFLSNLGHDVTAIASEYPHSLPDKEVLAIANREQRILITNDKDFGELIFHQGLPHHGVLFFRLKTTTYERKQERLSYVLTHYTDRLSQYLVITDHRVTIPRRRSN